jgi:hypothetical protein
LANFAKIKHTRRIRGRFVLGLEAVGFVRLHTIRAFAIGLAALCAAECVGCGGVRTVPSLVSNPATALPARHQDLAPEAAATYIYTCQNGTTFDCLVYNARGKLLRTLTTGVQSPDGVAAGKDGRFYVANNFGDNLLVYSAGGRELLRKLDNGGNAPLDVAVYHDTLAVSNLRNMTFFSAGATKPTRTLNDPSVVQGSGAAFDLKGNCYWSLVNQRLTTQVDEFKGCKGKPNKLDITPGSPYGIAFDGKDNLYYTSFSTQANGVYKCTGVRSCALVYNQFIDPQYLNFSNNFAYLWINDPGNISNGSALYEIHVATGKLVRKITSGLSFFDPPTGVAVGPGPL